MGKRAIVEVHLGKDQKARVASVQLPGKTIIKRPIVKLSPLDFDDKITQSQQKVTHNSDSKITQSSPKRTI